MPSQAFLPQPFPLSLPASLPSLSFFSRQASSYQSRSCDEASPSVLESLRQQSRSSVSLGTGVRTRPFLDPALWRGSPASSQPAACIPVASQTSWVSLSGAEFSGQLILAVSSRARFCHHDKVPFTLARGFSLCPFHVHPFPLPLAQLLTHGQGQGLSYLRKPKASRGAFGPFLPSLEGLGEGISTVPP